MLAIIYVYNYVHVAYETVFTDFSSLIKQQNYRIARLIFLIVEYTQSIFFIKLRITNVHQKYILQTLSSDLIVPLACKKSEIHMQLYVQIQSCNFCIKFLHLIIQE